MCATSCNHTFAYHSVIPPTHCPLCGACLGCGQRTRPYPYPVAPYPYPYRPPIYWQSDGTNTAPARFRNTVSV